MCEAVREWREELLTEGKAEGHAEGKAEGKAEGEAKGKEHTENVFAQLAEAMRKHNCPSEDFARVMSDAAFREKMKQKYGIE